MKKTFAMPKELPMIGNIMRRSNHLIQNVDFHKDFIDFLLKGVIKAWRVIIN